jgi:hypothetical protein
MTVAGLETYVLVPSAPDGLDLFLSTLRSDPQPTDLDLVIGNRVGVAPTTMCNGLTLPLVTVDQIYSFDRGTLIAAIPHDDEAKSKSKATQFRRSAAEVLDHMISLADNAGATDEHRAVNYLAVRYPAIYGLAFEALEQNKALTAVEVRLSPLTGARNIVDVIFVFTDRATDVVEKHFVRVDVTEKWPFLASRLAPYFDR